MPKIKEYEPVSGNALFNALYNKGAIIMAANPRITKGVVRGIFRAAKDLDAPIIFELAKSESDLFGGYTGLKPADFSKKVKEVAEEVRHDVWVLHADHITIKEGTPEEINETKRLIDAQITAGYTSFAIDASFLFDESGITVEEQLSKNIEVTTEMVNYIEEQMAGIPFGLEVEVGEIGKMDKYGRVLTTPEEALTFLKSLNANGIHPHVLAIANGSAHGNIYDEKGNLIEQVSIDIPQTIRVIKTLRENGFKVCIAQHGITGTPRDMINLKFPKGDIIKGNVATFWQNLVWNIFKVYQPDLYQKIWNWTVTNYKKKIPNKTENEIFGKYSKFAIKQFFNDIYAIDFYTEQAIESLAYAEALIFIRAFGTAGLAKHVRKAMQSH